MPKRILVQRKGKGSIFKAKKKAVFTAKYRGIDAEQVNEKTLGEIVLFVHDSSKSSVLAKVLFGDQSFCYNIASEGQAVGQRVEFGSGASIELGNVITLGNCVEGCPVFNIERVPGDGGSLVRAGGSYALIVTKDRDKVFVKFPSGKTAAMNAGCRATIGLAAGGGRTEKPLVKAGSNYHLKRAKRKKYPVVRGVAMNPNSHPFGGSQHHPGKSKSTSRHAFPGRKVGAIASKRTGRIKK